MIVQAGRGAEVKCVTVCPSRTELVAVGANDPYVRVTLTLAVRSKILNPVGSSDLIV